MFVLSAIGFAGMYLVSSGLMGYMTRDLNGIMRAICIIGGLCLIIPGTVTDVTGIVVLVAMLAIQWWQGKRIAVAK